MNTWHRLINASASPALLLGSDQRALPRSSSTEPKTSSSTTPTGSLTGTTGLPTTSRSRDWGPTRFRGGPATSATSSRMPSTRPSHWMASAGRDTGPSSGASRETPSAGSLPSIPPAGIPRRTHTTPGPIIVCLSGKGYSITWPREAGTQPWKNGRGDLVKRQDYGPGGIVSAAPGNANWFHGHFGASAEPLRVLAFLGGFPRRTAGAPGVEMHVHNVNVKEGVETRSSTRMKTPTSEADVQATTGQRQAQSSTCQRNCMRPRPSQEIVPDRAWKPLSYNREETTCVHQTPHETDREERQDCMARR